MKGILVAVTLIAAALPVHAQSPAPSPDEQRAAVATIAAVRQFVFTDFALYNTITPTLKALNVGGWGFECSSGSRGYIEVVIDGIVDSDALVWRWERADVWKWAVKSGACSMAATPYVSGAYAVSDVSKLTPGMHTVFLRIRNQNGVVTPSTRPVPFYIPFPPPK